MKTIIALLGIAILLVSCGGQVPSQESDSGTDSTMVATQSPDADTEPSCDYQDLQQTSDFPSCYVASNKSPAGLYLIWTHVRETTCDFMTSGDHKIYDKVLVSETCGQWQATITQPVTSPKRCCVTSVSNYTTKLYKRLGTTRYNFDCSDGTQCTATVDFGRTYFLNQN